MRKLFSTLAAFLLLALAGQAQPPARRGGSRAGGRGGFAPTNLQVLDPANLPAAMQSYVQAWAFWIRGFVTIATSRTALQTRRCKS